MLNIPDSGLMFPILGYVGKTSRARGAPERALYTLTWAEQETELKQKKPKGATSLSRFGLVDPECNTGLPFQYDELAWKTKFAIPKDYATEIQRMSLAANTDWALDRPFDTNVRERCLEPAIEYIWCAFYLIGDCVWDDEGHYFDRSWLSIAIPYMLAYKFWRGQTGSGLVCDHAKIDKLREIVEVKGGRMGMAPETRAPIIDLLGAIDLHERNISERGMTHQPAVDDIFNPSLDDGLFPVDKEKE